ncbi:zinc finger BED domain-containing protein RICESLEEPER 2-like protein [Tanacetum coccineum]
MAEAFISTCQEMKASSSNLRYADNNDAIDDHIEVVKIVDDHDVVDVDSENANGVGDEKTVDNEKKGGRSTLASHLTNVCRTSPLYKKNIDSKKQATLGFKPISEGDITGGSLATHSFSQERCRKALARLCIKDNQPFSIVDNEGFQDYSWEMNPLFKMPSRMVYQCLQKWGIERVFTVTVDNASSNDGAIKFLGKMLKGPHAVLDCKYLHLRCCAHILNLVVRDGLEEQFKSISKIRNAVRYVRSSPARAPSFRESVERVNIQCDKKPCLDKIKRKEKVCWAPEEDDWEKARHFIEYLRNANNPAVASESAFSTGDWIRSTPTDIGLQDMPVNVLEELQEKMEKIELGHEGVMNEVPDGAAIFASSYWLRNNDIWNECYDNEDELQSFRHKARQQDKVYDEREESCWILHLCTGIFYLKGHEGVMNEVPDGAAIFASSYWLRNSDMYRV